MFSMRFQSFGEMFELIGNWKDVIQLAHILERQAIFFKIARVGCLASSQRSLGCGDFRFWLDEEIKFPGERN